MIIEPIIEKVSFLPHDLDLELSVTAEQERFVPLEWLKKQWLDGSNQFSNPGEALFTARIGGRLVGICGLNRDPYDRTLKMGRLRRLYVLPGFRRRGIGRNLVLMALVNSREQFEGMNLRTLDANSAAFFERLGFMRVEGTETITHRILLA